MERDKALPELINILRRTSRMAQQSEWTDSGEDTAAFCFEQYNRVLSRLREIDESVGKLFEPLPAGSSLTVVAMACRQLAAYFEDEVGSQKGRPDRSYGFAFDSSMFKDFWEKSAHEFEDLGQFIRECIDEWSRVRKCKDEPAKKEEQTSPAGGTGDSEKPGA